MWCEDILKYAFGDSGFGNGWRVDVSACFIVRLIFWTTASIEIKEGHGKNKFFRNNKKKNLGDDVNLMFFKHT
jgi:hypothetical protein